MPHERWIKLNISTDRQSPEVAEQLDASNIYARVEPPKYAASFGKLIVGHIAEFNPAHRPVRTVLIERSEEKRLSNAYPDDDIVIEPVVQTDDSNEPNPLA